MLAQFISKTQRGFSQVRFCELVPRVKFNSTA